MVSNQSTEDMARPQEYPTLQRYYGVCVTAEWETVTLVAKANSEAEASESLHKGYNIIMVLEMHTQEEQIQKRKGLNPSLLSAGNYL